MPTKFNYDGERIPLYQMIYTSDRQTNKKTKIARNRKIWSYYFDSLLEDLLSIFEWENLPNGIPQYAVEWQLIRYGRGVLFRHPKENDIVWGGYTTTRYNRYYEPILIHTYPIFQGVGDMNFNLDDYSFVYCLNNLSGYPSYQMLLFYTDILSDLEISIQLANFQMRQPYLFEGSKSMKATIDRLMQNIEDGNLNYYVISKDFVDNSGLTVHDLIGTNGVQRLQALQMMKEKYYQEWYTKIGTHPNINNKRERLTENESIGYNEIGNLHIEGMLKSRKAFCERANEKFDLDIGVEFSKEIREEPKEIEAEELSDEELINLLNPPKGD